MSSWKEVRLRDICESVDYGLTASASPDPTGPKFLRITDIVAKQFDWSTVPYVSTGSDQMQRFRLYHGDIVIARTGATTGSSRWVANPPDAVFASYLIRLKIAKEVDSRFVGYLLKSHQFLSYVAGVLGDKSAQPNASATTLVNAVVRIPSSKSWQRAISEVLGSLDDRIAGSERVIRSCRSLGDCHLQALGVADARFTMGDLVARGQIQLGDGYRTKRSEYGRPGLPILRVAEVLDGHIDPSFEDYVSNDYQKAMSGKTSRPGDVILTTKGTVGRVALIVRSVPEFVYSPQLCFFRPMATSPFTSSYLFYWFRSEYFWSQARLLKGQTDMADYINLADIRSLVIGLPSEAECRKLSDSFDFLEKVVEQRLQQTKTLTELRDTLLSGLMSGEIRVRDAEKLVEEAT